MAIAAAPRSDRCRRRRKRRATCQKFASVALAVGLCGGAVQQPHASASAFAPLHRGRCWPHLCLNRSAATALLSSATSHVEGSMAGSPPIIAASAVAADSRDAGRTAPEEEEEEETFRTSAQRLYIEDTDAYGVVYNSNYLRIYDRALHWAGISGRAAEGGVLTQEDWYITEVAGQKFRASPPLGGEYVVHGRLKERAGCGSREVWEVRMTGSRPGGEDDRERGEKDHSAVLYNAATVTVSKPDHLVPPSLLPPKPAPLPRSEPSVEYAYVPFRDEYDLHLGPTHLPLQSCLNLFERSRSDLMGGPDALRRMKDEHGLIWVVTGVEDCALVNIGHAPDDEDGDVEEEEDVRCFPGGEVAVRTDYSPKRRGAVLECRHTLLVRGETRRRRLAQAVFTIMALDDKTRRPSRGVPEWIKEKIYGSGTEKA